MTQEELARSITNKATARARNECRKTILAMDDLIRRSGLTGRAIGTGLGREAMYADDVLDYLSAAIEANLAKLIESEILSRLCAQKFEAQPGSYIEDTL